MQDISDESPGLPRLAQDLPVSEAVELLQHDQARRWRRGVRLPAETYFNLFPPLSGDDEHGFDLVYGEILLREELGESPLREEFECRFPRFSTQLARQYEFDAAISAGETVVWADNLGETPTPAGKNALAAPSKKRPSPLTEEIPGYEILGELGRGGMGIVFEARQIGLDRVVALKVMRSGAWASPQERARIESEAALLGQLNHPGVVHVYEIGEFQGRPYFSMEYVAGGDLALRLRGGLPQLSWAAELVADLARVMGEAHRQGIVHRDLKPANILFPYRDKSGSSEVHDAADFRGPKITDFGLARGAHRPANITETGDVLGTPGYMSPEQAQGSSASAAPATDIYSLGAILYELLTGKPPFVGATPLDTLRRVIQEEPLPPNRLAPGVPSDLQAICLKCLEKEPAQRYRTADDLAQDLDRFLAGKPTLARPLGRIARTARWAKAHRLVTALTLGLVLSITGGIVGLATLWLKASVSAETARDERLQADALRFRTQSLLEQEAAQRKAAEENYTRARSAIDAFQRIASEHPGLRYINSTSARDAMLQVALDHYRGLASLPAESFATRETRWGSQYQVGVILVSENRGAEAEQAFQLALEYAQALRRDDPTDQHWEILVAQSESHLALAEGSAGHKEAAMARFRGVYPRLLGFVQEHPEDAERASDLAAMLGNLGWLESGAGDQNSAIGHLVEAKEWQEKAISLNPVEPRYRQFALNHNRGRGLALSRAGRVSAAIDSVIERRAMVAGDPIELYRAAGDLSACVELLDQGKSTDASGTEKRAGWIDEAIETLRQAVHAGFKNPKLLATDPRLNLLRGHAEFAGIVAASKE